MKNKNIESYIKAAPKEAQAHLKQMRVTIKKVAPKATERPVSSRALAYELNGKNLLYLGAFKNYIGFFPHPAATVAFKKEFAKYKPKRTIQFPHNKPLPLALIKRIVAFRVKKSQEKNSPKR